MSIDQLNVVRQFDFSHGPNFTNNIFDMGDKELADATNVYWDGAVRTFPGADRVVTTALTSTNKEIVGVYNYLKKDGSSYYIIATTQGELRYKSGAGWTTIATGLSTNAATRWSFTTYADTLVAASKNNAVKKWDGTTFANLGGSPPQSAFISNHTADYMLTGGHAANPIIVQWNDTGDKNTWPVGNALNVGRDDGSLLSGIIKFGDVSALFKQRSVWLLSGLTPADFAINPTPSEVGCIAPNSIVLVDSGIFMWSEGGPAIFNGFKTNLLGRRLKAVLDEVDWAAAYKISAAYYPQRKHLLISYQRSGQSNPDRIMILDLYRLGQDKDNPPVFWPAQFNVSSMGQFIDTDTQRHVFMGHSNGFLTRWAQSTSLSTTFNGQTITPSITTRGITLRDGVDFELALRFIDVRTTGSGGQIKVLYSVDGSTTFSTQGETPYTMTSGPLRQKRLHGTGTTTGGHPVGFVHQLKFTTTGITGYTLLGYNAGLEKLSRREMT